MSLWGYPDLPPLNIVVIIIAVVVIISEQYEPAVLLERSRYVISWRVCLKCRFLGFCTVNPDLASLGKDLRNLLTGDSGTAGQRVTLGKLIPKFPPLQNDDGR